LLIFDVMDDFLNLDGLFIPFYLHHPSEINQSSFTSKINNHVIVIRQSK